MPLFPEMGRDIERVGVLEPGVTVRNSLVVVALADLLLKWRFKSYVWKK